MRAPMVSCLLFLPVCEDAPLSDPKRLPLTSSAVPMPSHVPLSETGNGLDPTSDVLLYHQQTKHHQDRYARSLGYLDWATQPDPFRTFQGAKRIELPLAADGLTTSYADLYTPLAVPARPLDLESIAILFELALGLSAWKEFRGNRWALRCNPSSGNLHPTEGYAVLPPLPHFEAGVYHYVSREHCLEQRCILKDDAAAELARALPADSFLVGLSSIHWREAWKYGERAFRYCQHDAGHAIATVRYAAAALGWSALVLDSFADDDVAALLGLDRATDFAGVAPQDREHPDVLILVSAHAGVRPTRGLPVEGVRAGHWAGQANKLSPSHVEWEIIDAVAEATRKPATPSPEQIRHPVLPPLSSTRRTSAATLDPPAPQLPGSRWSDLHLCRNFLPDARSSCCRALTCLPGMPCPGCPNCTWPHFVHRITGLIPGLYLLERDQGIHDRLRAALRPTFLWTKPAACPEHLRLFYLMKGDLQRTAQIVSCHQEIAADGAFSLGMIADFARRSAATVPGGIAGCSGRLASSAKCCTWKPRQPACARTGIGCYFDDTFHELLGLRGDEFQDLYHFTVGGPVEDRRLLTFPPYLHRMVRPCP